MADRELRIKVGAAIDSSFTSVMREVIDTAKRARKQISAEMKAGAKETTKAYQDEGKATEKVFLDSASVAKSIANKMKADVSAAAKARVKDQKAANKEMDADAKAHSINLNAELKRQVSDEIAANRRKNAERKAAARDWAKQEKALNNEMNSHIAIARRKQAQEGGGSSGLSRGGYLAIRTGMAGIGAAGRLVGSMAQGMGVDTSLSSNLSESVKREKLANTLANNAMISGGKGPEGSQTRQDPAAIIASATRAGIATGTETNDMLEGLTRFVALTGDLKTGQDIMEELGRTAKADGVEFHDMMDAVGLVSQAMGDMTNKGPAIIALTRSMAGMGQVGSVEFRSLAKNMGYLTSQSHNFKVDPLWEKKLSSVGIHDQVSQRLAIVNAMTNYARAGGRTSDKLAARSAMAFVQDLANPNEVKKMRAAGLSTFADAGHTQVRDPIAMMAEVFRTSYREGHKGGVSLDVINRLIPNIQSRAMINAVSFDYSAAYNKSAAGGEKDEGKRHHAATQAITEKFLSYFGSTQSLGDNNLKFAETMKDADSQAIVLKNEWGILIDQLRVGLTPALGEAIRGVRALTPAFKGVADYITKFFGGDDPNVKRGDAVYDSAVDTTHSVVDSLAAGKTVDNNALTDAERTIKAEIDRKKAEIKTEKGKRSWTDPFDESGRQAARVKDLTTSLDNLQAQLKRMETLDPAVKRVNDRNLYNEVLKVQVVNMEPPGAKPATRGIADPDAGFGVSYPSIRP